LPRALRALNSPPIASLALASPALTRATIISRSNSLKMHEHTEHRPAAWRVGADRLGVDVEPGPRGSDELKHLDQMLEAAAEPIG